MSYGSPSQVDQALFIGLEDNRFGNAVLLSAFPSSSRGSVILFTDSGDTSRVHGCRASILVGGKEEYGSFKEVADDMRHMGEQQNNCLNEIILLKG